MYFAYMLAIIVIVNSNLIHLFITLLFVSGHTSTVWALSFSASGDRMVSCRYAKISFARVFNCFITFFNFCDIFLWQTFMAAMILP